MYAITIANYGTIFLNDKSGTMDAEHIILESVAEANRNGADFKDGQKLQIELTAPDKSVTRWRVECRMAYNIWPARIKENNE